MPLHLKQLEKMMSDVALLFCRAVAVEEYHCVGTRARACSFQARLEDSEAETDL